MTGGNRSSTEVGRPDSNLRFGYPNPNLRFGFESETVIENESQKSRKSGAICDPFLREIDQFVVNFTEKVIL